MVTHFNAGHAFAYGFDDAAAFMAKNRRENAFRVGAGQGVGVGMTDAGRDDTHQHFTFLRWH